MEKANPYIVLPTKWLKPLISFLLVSKHLPKVDPSILSSLTNNYSTDFIIYPEEVEQCLEKNKHPQGSRTRWSHLCFILSWFLRDFAPYVCEPLAAIFNASIREGSVLQIWKAAEVPITSQYQKSSDRGT